MATAAVNTAIGGVTIDNIRSTSAGDEAVAATTAAAASYQVR